ncbi:MAG TPA: lanthionine synthetase LanC family protein [Allosphingosinicella sp.]|nr:lanthionine synthetase LanC family protein [Allosphingosinicella sp.]
MFLAELHRVTRDPVVGATAAGALEHAFSRVDDVPAGLHAGFYTGWLGIGHVAVEAARCLASPELEARGLALIRGAIAKAEDAVDIMSGNAGMIGPLLRHAAGAPDRADLVEAARAAGERLLAAASTGERGLSWDTVGDMKKVVEESGLGQDAGLPWMESDHPHLTGLSHGAGGVAVALLELAKVTGDPRFSEAARAAFAYEDSWFNQAGDFWPDLRLDDQQAAGQSAWCHGAAGIGLARLQAYRLTGDKSYLEGVERALRVAAKSLVRAFAAGSPSYCLCHGAAGDAELFMLAAETLRDMDAAQLVSAVAWHGLTTFADPKAPWPSGVPGAQEAPGLMLGAAGTGHFYLRVADPAATPSILLVSPAG